MGWGWKYSSTCLDGNDVEAVFDFISYRYPGRFIYQVKIAPPIDDFNQIVTFHVKIKAYLLEPFVILKFTSEEFHSRDGLLSYCFPYIDSLLEGWDNEQTLSTQSGGEGDLLSDG